jgi:hypothetical protein
VLYWRARRNAALPTPEMPQLQAVCILAGVKIFLLAVAQVHGRTVRGESVSASTGVSNGNFLLNFKSLQRFRAGNVR